MSASTRPSILALATVVMLAYPWTATGAPQDPPAGATLSRQVGPHRFAGAIGVPNPFLSTYVRSTTGFAATSGMEVGLFNFEDPPQLLATKPVDLNYLLQAFEFQQRVGDGVAVRLSLSGSGRLGTDAAALLTEGVSAITGWTLGSTIRLAERPGFKLSGSLDAARNALTIISIRSFVEDAVANPDTTGEISQGQSNFRASTGLRAAWGKSETMGYLVFADLGLQEPYDESEDNEFFWQAGGAVSIDMRERWRPDLAFLVSANYVSSSSRNEDLGGGGWTSGLGIFYSGRPELTVGVQTFYTRLTQTTTDKKFGAFGLSLLLRYDFS
jgi:hypothetical protein